MTTFSAAALAAQCQAIHHRALSAATTIAETVGQREASDSLFIQVSVNLRKLSETVFEVGDKLSRHEVISPRLQQTLTDRLDKCDIAEAIVERGTIIYTGDSLPSEDLLLSEFETWMSLEASVMQSLVEAIQMNTTDGQDKPLDDGEYRELLKMTDSAFEAVLRSDTSPPFHTNDEPPPPYDEETSEPVSDVKRVEPPASPTAVPSSSKTAPQSKLSEVFRAVTAPFRYKPEPLVMALCEAASRGDISTVASLASSGTNINGRNDEGKTPIVLAIEHQQPLVVTKLLQLGVSKDVCDSAKKLPPLFWAASASDIPMAKLLLQHGCNPNHKSLYGSAYFLDIVDKGDLGMVQVLLDHGADVNAADRYGRVAIQHAYSGNNLAMLKFLQSRGGLVNATDMTGNPIIVLALRENKDEIFDFLLERGANVNSKSNAGIPLIMEAFTKRRISVVKKLLERGADPNAKDYMGISVLMNTIKDQALSAKDREELMKLLLTYGANPNECDSWGKTAVSFLIEREQTSLVPLLLEKGLDPNQELGKGKTLLIYAISCGKTELTKKLLQHGARPNAVDKKGCTPLVQALKAGDTETVKLLVASGADVNKMGAITPLNLARLLESKETAELLLKHGARQDSFPYSAT